MEPSSLSCGIRAVSSGTWQNPPRRMATARHEAAERLFEDCRFTVFDRARVIEIAPVSVGELGFREGATRARLAARAAESGLLECPLELGPHLRLQFQDQAEAATGGRPEGGGAPPGSVTVMSAPLDDAEATPSGFYLRRVDGASWLRGYRSSPDHVWRPGDVLVFSRVGAAA